MYSCTPTLPEGAVHLVQVEDKICGIQYIFDNLYTFKTTTNSGYMAARRVMISYPLL